MNLISKHKHLVIGIGAGAVAGYAYYYFIGCSSGSCAITSHPLNSAAYGALMGALLFTSFKNESKKSTKSNEKE